MSALNQQTLTESGANDRPLMLKKGNYIPWESRFRRFLDKKLKDGEWMWRSIQKGPYVRPMITDPADTTKQIIEPLSKMTEMNKKQYTANVRVMNYLLQAIPNDIYNLADACKNAKEMWERIKRLMYDFEVTNHVRHSRLMDELDKFAAKEGELLESVYERLTMLVNIMDRNNASKAKRAAMNHDPLALIAHSNASSQSHASPSYSNSPQPYYVTHPSSVKFFTPTNNRLHTSSNTRNQAVIQDGRVDIQTKNAGYGRNGKANAQCYNCNEKGHYAHDCQKPRVRDAKYFREQMLLAMKDEAGSNLNAGENDFMLDNSFGDETLEELTVVVIMMVGIQPADDNAVTEPTYDAKAISKVNTSHKAHEQVNHLKRKTSIHTSNNDQIDSNIIFDDTYVENNGGTSEHDSTDHDEYHNIQILAYNVQREAENQKGITMSLKSKKS
ncbi:putative ribonuclease H-like domain-containing protein [Tanacetum coccineum]